MKTLLISVRKNRNCRDPFKTVLYIQRCLLSKRCSSFEVYSVKKNRLLPGPPKKCQKTKEIN